MAQAFHQISTPTLSRRAHPLASTAQQMEVLHRACVDLSFEQTLKSFGCSSLKAERPTVLQMNLGKRCNQVCRHCHVDAGPDRREEMPDDVIEACFQILQAASAMTLDITGGAPELHPRFRTIVKRARALGIPVMDRCNLTIAATRRFADLPDFLAEHRVEVIASLPSFAAYGTDRQRGSGVFDASIKVLRAFNALGYGREGSGLLLHLVTNPVGAFLPGSQSALQREWKRELKRRYDIEFNSLFTITNMPISRYLEFLLESGNLEAYMARLIAAFNPAAVEGLMCRYTLSVGWDGRLFDCDFNQMLDIALPQSVFELDMDRLEGRLIRTAPHCFACTAGAGSSCGGATTA